MSRYDELLHKRSEDMRAVVRRGRQLAATAFGPLADDSGAPVQEPDPVMVCGASSRELRWIAKGPFRITLVNFARAVEVKLGSVGVVAQFAPQKVTVSYVPRYLVPESSDAEVLPLWLVYRGFDAVLVPGILTPLGMSYRSAGAAPAATIEATRPGGESG